MTATQKYEWKLELKCRDRGHKYFLDKRTDRIAIADWSGHFPDQTDDGVIWLDLNRPVNVGLREANIPTIRADDESRKGFTGETALGGLEVAQKFGLTVVFNPEAREFIEAALKVVRIS